MSDRDPTSEREPTGEVEPTGEGEATSQGEPASEGEATSQGEAEATPEGEGGAETPVETDPAASDESADAPSEAPPSEAPPVPAEPTVEVPVRAIVTGTIWITGALIWAYTVAGEFLYHGDDIPEAFGVIALLVALGLAWWGAVRHLPESRKRRLFMAAPGVLAIGSWLVIVTLTAMVFADSGRSNAEGTSLLLWMVGTALYFVGRKATRRPDVKRSTPHRVLNVLIWMFVVLATLAAGGVVANRI